LFKIILGQKTPLGKSKRIARQGSSNNLLEPELRYVDFRPRLQKILVHSLRNEADSLNMQYSLALSALFCVESTKYDLRRKNLDISNKKGDGKDKSDGQAKSK